MVVLDLDITTHTHAHTVCVFLFVSNKWYGTNNEVELFVVCLEQPRNEMAFSPLMNSSGFRWSKLWMGSVRGSDLCHYCSVD